MEGLSKLLKQKIDFYLRNMTLDLLFFDQISEHAKIYEEIRWWDRLCGIDDPINFENFLKYQKCEPYDSFEREKLLENKNLKITRILNLEIRTTRPWNYCFYNTQVYRFQDFLLIQKDEYEVQPEEYRLNNFEDWEFEEELLESHLSRVKIIHLAHFDYRTLLDKNLSVNDYLKVYNYFRND